MWCEFAIIKFIEVAAENGSTNCTAELMEYKNKNYPDFDAMDELVLE